MPKRIEPNILLSETEAAYIAGFVDGEGCFGVYYIKNKRHIKPYFRIVNTNLDVIFYLKSLIGGRIIITPSRGNHKEKYELCLDSQKLIYHIIPKIQKYLIVKKKQATLIFSWIYQRINDNRYNRRYTENDFKLIEKVQVLNQRGVKNS